MSTSHARPATVGWFEITTTDPLHSQKFYEEIFDWRFDPFGGDAPYSTITAPGAETSMGALRGGSREMLCIGIVCHDAAKALRNLEALGATPVEQLQPTPAGDIHAFVLDIRGNRLELFQPAAPANPDVRNTASDLNATAFFEIGTRDLATTQEFYRRAFGWTTERDEAAEGVAYYSIRAAETSAEIGGMLDISGMEGMTDYAIPGVRVADVGELLERAEAAGGTRVMGPFPDANGVVVGQFLDPAGNRWSSFALPSSE